MRQREFAQRRAAGLSKTHPDLSFVVGAGLSRDRTCLFQTVHQFHRAVMLNKKAACDLSNRRFNAFGKTMDREQELMLLSLDSVLLCRSLTEEQKLPYLSAKLG